MKLNMRSILAALLLVSVLTPAASNNVLTVAVFDFESKDEGLRDAGPKAAALINASLSANPAIVTVERAELEKVLGEQELTLSGNVNPAAAVKTGQLTGAQVLVTGRVFKAANEQVLVAKVISTETSRVFGEMVKGSADARLTDLASEMAGKIAKIMIQNGDSLIAKVETREERVGKIKQALAGKQLPSVSVNIGEQHFGARVVDPAAETELNWMLQQCGFKTVDPSSTNKAQVEITGDAFSAFGIRKGNLVSCKARVELKVREVASNRVIANERQTSVAVDIAEQTAAKTALANATSELAKRLLPQLVGP